MRTALMEAVGGGHYVCMDLLLQAGAGVNMVDQTKRSALTHAVMAKDFKSAVKLIETGADVNLRDEKGSTALISAAQNHALNEKKQLSCRRKCRDFV